MIAGLANGTYLSPIKKHDPHVHLIWITFSVIAYLLLPIILIVITLLTHHYTIPTSATIIMLITGLIYGLGLFLLTESIKLIGIGIPLALNISLGILTGSFFSILISGNINTIFNHEYAVAYITIFIAVVLYSIALSLREHKNKKPGQIGLLLTIIGSILCSSQGACLSYYSDFLKIHNHGFTSQLMPWSLIFIGCAIVFIFSHLIQHKRKKQINSLKCNSIFVPAIIMSSLQIFSVLVYTQANIHTQKYSQIYLWGIFMGCIVLASTACSYLKHEWKHARHRANIINFVGVLFLILSVIQLSVLGA
jgi:hypothetical protein